MIKKVVEYFLDGNNIKGWQLWTVEKRPDLKNNPMPNNIDAFNLKDQYGNYKYRLENNQIIENNIISTEKQLIEEEIKNLSKKDLLKLMIKGIENKNDPEYISIKTKIIKLSE